MIQIHKDLQGTITGYFDTEQNCWVSAPQAADADDAKEPEADPIPLDQWTKDQLVHWLREHGFNPSSKDTKAQLITKVQDLLNVQEG